jgi:hypothetical protein
MGAQHGFNVDLNVCLRGLWGSSDCAKLIREPSARPLHSADLSVLDP